MTRATASPRVDRWTLPLLRAVAFAATVASTQIVLDPRASHSALAAAFALGWVATAAYRHRQRVLGFAPPAFLAALAAAGLALVWDNPLVIGPVMAAAVGALNGVFDFRRATERYADVARWQAALLPVALVACVAYSAVYCAPREEALFVAAAGTGAFALVGTVASWRRLFRPLFELFSEAILSVMYRVRTAPRPMPPLPPSGPCLVLANHACWFDPLFLAKVLPRAVTPMMTSRFYDVWPLRWLMRDVFHTIRVPEKSYKHEAPELDEAVAALDRGECLVIFPEGFLRRSDDQPLRRFGRGVWHILTQRPETPVVCCWIEGAWRSYTSYAGGPPTKNKRVDVRRPIRVAVAPPTTVSPDVLAGHLQTRIALMNAILSARSILGLAPLPAFPTQGLPQGEDGAGDSSAPDA